MSVLTYEEWTERDDNFNLVISIIYDINRGLKGSLEEHLKKEYKKYLKEKGNENENF